jgi:hypothetical protein
MKTTTAYGFLRAAVMSFMYVLDRGKPEVRTARGGHALGAIREDRREGYGFPESESNANAESATRCAG